jgi:hypothetical protein
MSSLTCLLDTLSVLIAKFTEYIEKCKNDYEEVTNMTYQNLMRKVDRKYQSRIMSSEWNTLTQEQEEIVALKSRLASLHAPRRQTDTTSKKKIFENSNNQKNQKASNIKRESTGDQKWHNTKPLRHEPKTKTVKGQTWHFCDHHQAWRRHDTEKFIQKPSHKTNKHNNLEASLAMKMIGVEDLQISDNE